jgi:hypothetical protein
MDSPVPYALSGKKGDSLEITCRLDLSHEIANQDHEIAA